MAFGPGSAGYVPAQVVRRCVRRVLPAARADGINKSNTLFVFTVDEGDHFVGIQKTNCDGVNVPCQYGTNEVGEINANIDTLFNSRLRACTQPAGRSTSRCTVTMLRRSIFRESRSVRSGRDFERATAGLTAVKSLHGQDGHTLMRAMADREEMKALHMYTDGDPLRDPTFAYFADPDYFLTDFPTSTCQTCINPLFAWNHGDIQPEIANTWLGFVGPGVQQLGVDGQVWSDHDGRGPDDATPLLGLTPNWQSDGRVLVQALDGSAVPQSLGHTADAFVQLADAYKQLNAPFGSFGMDTLTASTKAIADGIGVERQHVHRVRPASSHSCGAA